MLNGLMMKQLFSDGNSIQIEFRDKLRNKRVYKTLIHKVTEEQLSLFIPEEQLIPIHPGTKLSVISNPPHQSGSFYFTSQVIDYQQGNPSVLIISKPAPIETVSRRKFFRCDVDLPFAYLDYENIEQKGTVINLSASGLMAVIFYDNHLKASSHLQCQLLLPTILEPLKFEAKIIRIERTEREYQRALAMNFENITEKFQNDITKYLFQRQRELIKLGHIKVGRI